MPFFIANNQKRVVSLTGTASPRAGAALTGQASPRAIALLAGQAKPRYVVELDAQAAGQRRLAYLLGVARAPERQFRQLTGQGRSITNRTVRTLTGTAGGTGTTAIQTGVPESWRITTYSTTLGQHIKSWTYSRPNGLNSSLQVKLRGDRRSAANDTLRLTVKAENPHTGQRFVFSTEALVGNGIYDFQGGVGSETTLNFVSTVSQKLGMVLPALVPWEEDPPAETDNRLSCDQRKALRKRLSVRSLLGQVLTHADLKVKYLPESYANLFSGEIIQGTAADYGTKGKTAQQVLNDFYGRAGAVFATQDDTLLIIHPEYSQNAITDLSTALRYCTNSTISNPSGSPLGRVFLTGLPEEQSFQEAFGSLPDAPDQQAIQFELQDNVIDTHVQQGPDSTVYQGTEKQKGKVVRVGSIELGTVVVPPPEGEELPERVFTRVPKEQTVTQNHYSETCEGQLLSSVSEHKTWAYRHNTTLQSVALSIPGFTFGVSGGTLLGQERTVTHHEWSPQGWLKRRFATSTKTASMVLENAGEENEHLLSGLTVRQTTEERWLPVGAGRWIYSRVVSGDQLTPVTDDTGAWITLEKKTGVIESISEETDNAPDTATCECDDVLVPREHEWTDPDGTESVEENFPTETQLEPIRASIVASRKIRVVRENTLGLPLPVRYRDLLNGGIITNITASGNGGAGFSMTITREEVTP